MLNNELKKLKLGKAAKVISGYAFKSIDFHNDENHIPVVKINNIKNEYVDINGCNLVSNDFKTKLNSKYILKKGDLLISLTGSHLSQPNSVVGRVAKYRLDEIALLNQRAGKIIIKDDAKLDKEYLYYYLSSNTLRVEIALKATGAASQANISPSDVESLVMLLPTLPQQKKIANILYSYDKLIQNNTKRISILEQMAEQLYKEWFVRMRFPNYENTKFIKGIPKVWEIMPVEKLVNRKKFGKTYKQDEVFEEGKVIVVDQSVKDYLGFHNQQAGHNASVNNPYLLFGDHSCKMVLMTQPFSLGENIIPFIPKNGIQPYFLFQLINELVETTEYKRHWKELIVKKVVIPTSELQIKFSELIKPLFKEKEFLVNSIRNLKKTRDLLLPRLISGKLKLNKKL
jgi:type I restriction enzyme S subunit